MLDGARQILMEKFAEDADLLAQLREYLRTRHIRSGRRSSRRQGSRRRQVPRLVRLRRAIAAMPSHRALALLRGRNEGMLGVSLVLDSELDEEAIKPGPNPCEQRIAARFGIRHQNRPADKWLQDTVRWTWKIKVFTHLNWN